MKTFRKLSVIALLLSAWTTLDVSAAVVKFNFSGVVTYMRDNSNAIPADIQYDTAVIGSLSYDTATIRNGMDFDSSTNGGSYYFSSNGVFSISVKIASHTFSNTVHTTEFPYADIIIHNDYYGEDGFSAEDASPYVKMDGGAFPGDCDQAYISMEFTDNTATAFNSDALPTVPFSAAQFQTAHKVSVYGYKNGNFVFQLTAVITDVDGVLPPTLKLQTQPNQTVKLSWPLEASGFNLLQNTNLAKGIGWTTNATAVVDTASEHTVTLPASASSMFFRLKN